MSGFIPSFEFDTVFMQPWEWDPMGTAWIIVMGFLANAACGLVGTFLVFRRMALMGDAISHSILPGIVIAFLISGSRGVLPMMLGAVAAGLVTVVLIEAIHRGSRVKADAALGIVFSTLFAFGVILLALFADKIDLDPDCVLYGEIGLIPLMQQVTIGTLDLGPRPLVQMAVVLTTLLALLFLFYRQLLVTSFDPALARSLGLRVGFYHYGLMFCLSLTVVSAFEAVGAILVIAMLIFPSVTASLLSDRLPVILGLCFPFSAIYALSGFHLAVWLDTSIAGAMVVVAGALFGLAWVFSPRKGLLALMLARRQIAADTPEAIT